MMASFCSVPTTSQILYLLSCLFSQQPSKGSLVLSHFIDEVTEAHRKKKNQKMKLNSDLSDHRANTFLIIFCSLCGNENAS